MGIKERLENNLISVGVGVAVASGLVVAGVMNFVASSNLETKQLQHELVISQKDQRIEDLTDQVNDLTAENEQLLVKEDEREALMNFVSLHSRALTYAVVNRDRCLPYERSLGQLLRGFDWDFDTLRSQYEGAIRRLEEDGIAVHRQMRAGPSFLDYRDGGTWPIVELWQCTRN